MSKVWTPLRKPPSPSSIHLLSDDARLVLAALRQAHARKLEDQQRKFKKAQDGRGYYQQIYARSFKIEQNVDANEGIPLTTETAHNFKEARHSSCHTHFDEVASELPNHSRSSQITNMESQAVSCSGDGGARRPWSLASTETDRTQVTSNPHGSPQSFPLLSDSRTESTSEDNFTGCDNHKVLATRLYGGGNLGSEAKSGLGDVGDGQSFPGRQSPGSFMLPGTQTRGNEVNPSMSRSKASELDGGLSSKKLVPNVLSEGHSVCGNNRNSPGKLEKEDSEPLMGVFIKTKVSLLSSSVDVNLAAANQETGGSLDKERRLDNYKNASGIGSNRPDSTAPVKRKVIPVFPNQKHGVKRKMQGVSDTAKIEQFLTGGGNSNKVQPSAETTCSPWLNVEDLAALELEALHEKIADAQQILLTLLYTDGSSQLREHGDLSNFERRKPAGTFQEDDGKADAVLVEIQTARKVRLQHSLITFPLGHSGPSTTSNPDIACKCLLAILKSPARKVCFDAQELMHTIILYYGLDPQIGCGRWVVQDPKVACWLLDPDHPAVTFSRVLGDHLPDRQSLAAPCRGKDIRNLQEDDLHQLEPVMNVLSAKLKQKELWELYINLEVRLCPILAAMEVQGVRVNPDILEVYGHILKEHISETEKRCFESAGHQFQINSHVKLRQILFDELKLDEQCPGQKLARTNVQNLKSTSETVLQKLKDVHPLPELVLNYRRLVKLKSTYIDGLKECLSEGYVHTSWEQTSAASGRLQSSNPNIQNIPKQPIVLQEKDSKAQESGGESQTVKTLRMREPFISQQGWTFIAADFQSIELRILAHLSRDPVLLKIFNDQGGTDIFVQLTCEWLGMMPEDVKPQDRERTKRIVYSVVYGVGPERLAETLNDSKENAKSFTKSFLGKFKGIQSFTHRCISECHRHKAVRTIFGRHRLIASIDSQNFHARTHAERQAVNFVVQGSAADICKIAMIQCMRELSERAKLRARLLVQIHDELLFEVHNEDVSEVKELLQSVMECTSWFCGKAIQLKVPLPVAFSVGQTWGSLKPVGVHTGDVR